MTNKIPNRFCAALSALALLGLGAASARAADTLVYAGGEVSGHRSTYGQVGGVTALPGSTLGNGWVARGTAYGLTYKYKGAPGSINGDVAGGDVSVGYQQSAAPGWWGFYTGPVYRHTDLSPRDPGSDAEGGNFGWMVMGEGEYNLTQELKFGLAANYAFSFNDTYWTRARLLYKLDKRMYLGPEAVLQGDRDYRAWSAGLALTGIPLNSSGSVEGGLKAGMRKTEDFSASPYGGAEIGYSF